MKNYTYGWALKDLGFAEVPEEQYNVYQKDMKAFVDSMNPVIAAARCGWDGVRYVVMRHEKDLMDGDPYMVLFCENGERWIPIAGNSKGCNFAVLGENLW